MRRAVAARRTHIHTYMRELITRNTVKPWDTKIQRFIKCHLISLLIRSCTQQWMRKTHDKDATVIHTNVTRVTELDNSEWTHNSSETFDVVSAQRQYSQVFCQQSTCTVNLHRRERPSFQLLINPIIFLATLQTNRKLSNALFDFAN